MHKLAHLDYDFHRATSGNGRVYDMPHLTGEKRAAENGLRCDLLIKLSARLEPTFHVSFTWPFSGLISYLLVIKEWRDPDSNRGHHDFQLCD